MSHLPEFGETAKGLARNPLGIIALFIVLVYGFASLVLGLSDRVQTGERLPLVWFLVTFPPMVLITFAWLVSRHHTKLYAPTDYREDTSFLQASARQVEIAVALGAAAARKLDAGASPDEVANDARAAVEVVAKVTPRAVENARRRVILWVDDRPSNNLFERQALAALGFRFVLSTSTEDALSRLKQQSFDVIISDMGRPPDSQAGYTLLDAVRNAGVRTPFFIYAGSRAAEHRAEAAKRGAQGVTNRPDELFDMVSEAAGAVLAPSGAMPNNELHLTNAARATDARR